MRILMPTIDHANLNYALCQAAFMGDTARVQLLLAQGANPNATITTPVTLDNGGGSEIIISAILLAANQGHITIIHKLIAQGANPNATATCIASLLFDPRVRTMSLLTQIIDYLRFKKPAFVESYIHEFQSLIPWVSQEIQTHALHFVIATLSAIDFINVMHLLTAMKNAGVDFDAPDADGYTALLSTIIGNHPMTFQLLLQLGANPSLIETNSGYTLLHRTIVQRSFACIKYLLPYLTDVSLKTHSGLSALHLLASMPTGEVSIQGSLYNMSTETEQTEMAALIIAHGADINALTEEEAKLTALHMAIGAQKYVLAHLLVEQGAKITIENGEHINSLEYLVIQDNMCHSLFNLLITKLTQEIPSVLERQKAIMSALTVAAQMEDKTNFEFMLTTCIPSHLQPALRYLANAKLDASLVLLSYLGIGIVEPVNIELNNINLRLRDPNNKPLAADFLSARYLHAAVTLLYIEDPHVSIEIIDRYLLEVSITLFALQSMRQNSIAFEEMLEVSRIITLSTELMHDGCRNPLIFAPLLYRGYKGIPEVLTLMQADPNLGKYMNRLTAFQAIVGEIVAEAAVSSITPAAAGPSHSGAAPFAGFSSSGLGTFFETPKDNELNALLSKYRLKAEPCLPDINKALRRAAALGHVGDIETLIQNYGANPNAADENPSSGKTALHHAASRGHQAAFDTLIALGANKDLKDANGQAAETYLTTTRVPKA